MKLNFDHSNSVFQKDRPLIFLKVQRDVESLKYMFENGWIPFYDNRVEYWYQTKSSRLKIKPISKKRKKELLGLQISNECHNSQITQPIGIEWYSSGSYEDFFFDDVFWGRVSFFENFVLYSVMNVIKSKKSYGTLSYYYLLDKYLGKFEYLYITDYFEQFSYKKNLQGFEFWDGIKWN
jgi:hypothetical protein